MVLETRKTRQRYQGDKGGANPFDLCVLACLKGLKEQGCDGPVTSAINQIEKYINKQAHK